MNRFALSLTLTMFFLAGCGGPKKQSTSLLQAPLDSTATVPGPVTMTNVESKDSRFHVDLFAAAVSKHGVVGGSAGYGQRQGNTSVASNEDAVYLDSFGRRHIRRSRGYGGYGIVGGFSNYHVVGVALHPFVPEGSIVDVVGWITVINKAPITHKVYGAQGRQRLELECPGDGVLQPGESLVIEVTDYRPWAIYIAHMDDKGKWRGAAGNRKVLITARDPEAFIPIH